MGILNTTPDSFSDANQFIDPNTALEHAYNMAQSGAHMIDVGGESTRPGAEPVPLTEEWDRIMPVLDGLMHSYPDSVSVDTYHPETVRKIAAEIGPFVVNDVTGMNNPFMREAVAELSLRCIVSHLPFVAGGDIQKAHQAKPVDSAEQVVNELGQRLEEMVNAGIEPSGILVDPGFGFGKDPRINRDLLRLPELMHDDRFEYYIGVSRKSSLRREDFCGKPLADFKTMGEDEERQWLDNRSVEVAKIAVANGFSWIRVHNVGLHAAALL